MKPVFFLLFLLLSARVHTQEISGRLDHFPSTQFYINYSPDGITRKSDTIYVDDEGSFSHKLKMKYPAIGIIHFTDYISQDIFMGPGLQLHIEADVNGEKEYSNTLKMSLPASKYNRYFLKLEDSKQFRSYDIQTHYDSVIKLPEKEFVDFVNNFQLIRDSIRKSFFKPLNNDEQASYFSRTDSIQTKYNAMFWSIRYASNKKEDEKKNFCDKHITPFMKPLDEPAATTGLWFGYSWTEYLQFPFEESIKNGDTAWYPSKIPFEKQYGIADRISSSPGFLQLIYGGTAIPMLISSYRRIPISMVRQFDSAFDRMITRINDPAASQQIREQWKVGRKKGMMTRLGSSAPEFKVSDTLGNYYTLAHFKEKVLVIDVWSSYCGPCIKEFPFMSQLREKFSERGDLVFLNISIDQNRKAWIEKGLRKVSPVGMRLWAENGTGSEFANDYFIEHIPHIIVIDKNGRFVAYAAPSPSNGDRLEKLIRQALQ